MIYLLPHSGLANRIRVLVSGLAFADNLNQKLVIVWLKDNSLNCEFKDLFELHNRFSVYEDSFFLKLLNRMQTRPLLRKLIYALFQIDFTISDTDMHNLVWSTGTDKIDYTRLPTCAKNIFIHTCNEFHFDYYFLKFLRPVKSILNRVDAVASAFNEKTIGIHIRRTDHAGAIKNSPLNLFIDAMKIEIAKDGETNFFLATDDPETEYILMKKFPGKVIKCKKELSRSTKQGIKDAMVDLYCLARTKKIYGSYFSSFSDIAARIGNKKLKVLSLQN
ncbi:MAG TPA: hypothetical protein VGN63_03740 [Flavisolibacter sp.]|jgi:hypothetical protein|nr:hypothetical protein [Flavisolibacter sp.]